jgi:hypothetical protein
MQRGLRVCTVLRSAWALGLLLFSLGQLGWAGPKAFRSAEAFVASVPNANAQQTLIAKGDLNGDGLEDLALVLVLQSNAADTSRRTRQLIVLLQTKVGDYEIATASVAAEEVGVGCCWVDDLEIKNQSIYIQNNAKTASTMEAATHQFKLRNGFWQLAGVRIVFLDLGKDPQETTIQDFNTLNGKAIITFQKEGAAARARTLQQKQLKTPLLKNFDFNNGFGLPPKR